MIRRACLAFVALAFLWAGLWATPGHAEREPADRLGSAPVKSLPSPADRDRWLAALVAAYPRFLAGRSGDLLVWRDGTRMRTSDGRASKAPAELVEAPDIDDMFVWPYPLAAQGLGAPPTADPGRIRVERFFTRMYGDCRSGKVERSLVTVRWVGGRTILATRVNGVAAALERTARDLEALGPKYGAYLWPIGGTYSCRAIAGTARTSMHSYGAAIDLNTAYSVYWRWEDARLGGTAPYTNRLPLEIVAAFEKHGFIWGGRWAHFDTMHFEYRPELIAVAKANAARP
jgi:hypothetical protein